MLSVFEKPQEEIAVMLDYVLKMQERFYAMDAMSNEENQIWINSLIEHQDEKGFWKLTQSTHIPSDARVDFWYTPTYIATATLMKYWVEYPLEASKIERFQRTLKLGLRASMGRNFAGHGYDGMSGRLSTLEIFAHAKVLAFIEDYPRFSKAFVRLVEELETQLTLDLKNGNTIGSWGEDYKETMQRVWDALVKNYPYHKVFVYGTLMKGHYNHLSYLNEASYLGDRILSDYALYDLGNYPGIVQSVDEEVKGELYRVDKETLLKLDYLEDEGDLYNRVEVEVSDMDGLIKDRVYTYVYNKSIKTHKKVPYENQPWGKVVKENISSNKDYVWYVSYGSNMLYERFKYYIQGGICSFNNRFYNGCKDKRLPLRSESVIIPYQMYFGNTSRSWNDGGVAFLDKDMIGITLGRMYLITREQFNEIWIQEGKGQSWYNELIPLGEKEGIEILTFTNTNRVYSNNASKEYLKIVETGLLEIYPTLNDDCINSYLYS